MQQQLENRLQQLQSEYAEGQKRLQELEAEMSNLRTTVLRISGAIQVLQEELGKYEKQNKGNHISVK